eukprot:GFKZ01015665.1.p2 GENE.GFKZ01015665.1~~GFKZ01015665.1.p2  ORF type:complete len:131 (-),score=17.46 GFKZ01015665.1:66-458(-)
MQEMTPHPSVVHSFSAFVTWKNPVRQIHGQNGAGEAEGLGDGEAETEGVTDGVGLGEGSQQKKPLAPVDLEQALNAQLSTKMERRHSFIEAVIALLPTRQMHGHVCAMVTEARERVNKRTIEECMIGRWT